VSYKHTRTADNYINLLPIVKMAIVQVKACWVRK